MTRHEYRMTRTHAMKQLAKKLSEEDQIKVAKIFGRGFHAKPKPVNKKKEVDNQMVMEEFCT